MTDVEDQDYSDYIQSPQWRTKARFVRSRDDNKCQICGATDGPLEVHHLTYDRLYHERPEDLITLCHDCHAKVTDSWHGLRHELGDLRRFFKLEYRHRRAQEIADMLNTLMPYDISFGGKCALSGANNIRAACEQIGIECEHSTYINEVFSRIHVLDVGTQVSNGVPKWKLIESGYPKSLVQNIETRQQKHSDVIDEITDELVCYLHDGDGKWIVTAKDDGLDTDFVIRFMPSIRYGDRWWDSE